MSKRTKPKMARSWARRTRSGCELIPDRYFRSEIRPMVRWLKAVR